MYRIHLDALDRSFVCSAERSVLRAMECLGQRGIPVGCRGGGCGICRVRVAEGRYATQKMSRSCISLEQEAQGWVLACRLFPHSDLRLELDPRLSRQLARHVPQVPTQSAVTTVSNTNIKEDESTWQ